MINTLEKTINGSVVSVTQLPARRALRLKARLIKAFGPVFVQFLQGKTKEEREHSFVIAIEMLAASIDENSFENLIIGIVEGVRVNGMELTPAIIDVEFAGDLVQLYLIAWFVLEVNFANFFSMVGIGDPTSDMKATQTTTKTFKRT